MYIQIVLYYMARAWLQARHRILHTQPQQQHQRRRSQTVSVAASHSWVLRPVLAPFMGGVVIVCICARARVCVSVYICVCVCVCVCVRARGVLVL